MAENVEIRDIVFNLQVRTEDGRVKIDGLTKGFVKAETAMKKMQTTLNDVNTDLKGTGVSTGLANTAVLEFGRTISDAPYGIQGMGNNLTQLTTIIGQMANDTEKGTSVMKQLTGALAGPLGVVVAVQIAIAAFEIFRKSQEKAAKQTNTVVKAQAKAAIGLKLAKESLLDETVALEEKSEIIAALNEKYPEFNIQLEKSGQISEDNVTKIDQEINALERLAKAKAYQSIIEDLYAQKAQLTADFVSKQGTTYGQLEQAFLGLGNAFSGAVIQSDNLQKGLIDLDKQINIVTGMMKEDGLVDLIIGGDKKGKLKRDKREKVKTLVNDVYDTTFAEMAKRGKYAADMLERLGVPDIPTLLTGGPEGVEKLKDGIKSLKKEVNDALIDYSGVGISFNEILETMSPVFAEIGNFFSAEADRAVAIEENKTNRINDQLKRRLANEQLSAEERDKINQQIARNEAKLVEKENAINKKRFEQEKAFSIVQATVNTYLAASDVLAREKMGAIGKAIAVAAVIASGLAQVAAISRQQFTAKAMPSPNLTSQGGAGGGLGAPSFNVVGASSQNQLAAAIAGTQQQPVKAYVVSSDVSTAQELDRKIVEGASI